MPFKRTSQSLICVTLSATRIEVLLKILFVLLIAVNAGPLVPHFFMLYLDACSFTGYQESDSEYLEASPHGCGSPNIPQGPRQKYSLTACFQGNNAISVSRMSG